MTRSPDQPDSLRHALTVLRAVPEALLLTDGSGQVLLANDAAGRLLGRPTSALVGMTLLELLPSLPGRDLPERPLDAQAALPGGGTCPVRLTPVRTMEDGALRLVVHLHPVPLHAAAPNQHEALLQSMDGIVWEADAQSWVMLFVSQQAERILGYPVEDWYRDRNFWTDHIHPEDREVASTTCRQNMEAGKEQFSFEYRMLTSDGRAVWLQDYVTVIREEGRPTRLRGIMLDITARKEAEQAEHRREAELRQVTDALPACIVMVDRDLRYRFLNETAERWFKQPRSELMGRTMAETHAVPVEDLRSYLQPILEGETRELDRVRSFADGTTRDLHITLLPFRGPGGAVEGVIGLALDLTDLRRTQDALRRSEEQLRQSMKIQAMGRLSGSVAHDFNNLLTAILGHTELMLEMVGGPDDPLRQGLEEVKNASERAATLTRQLLAYSRKQAFKPRAVDLNEIVVGLDRLLRRFLGEDVELNVSLAPSLRPVRADPTQMEQALLSLAINARDAMPSGGRLTIETSNLELEEEFGEGDFLLPPGAYVMLAVSDTGTGMDHETRARLFEPLGARDETSGLGLSAVHAILKQVGGQILVYSEPGVGTSVKLYLPAQQAQAGAPPPKPKRTRARGGDETILVVEDDEIVRGLIQTVLAGHGYRLLMAREGEDALQLAALEQEPIALLVTDVVLGRGMNGRQLAERLQAEGRVDRVLYISGYTDEAVVRHGVLPEGSEFLNKPFAAHALAHRVRAVLDAARA